MKKIVTLLILALAVAALAACGGGGGETSAPSAEAIDVSALPPSVDVHTTQALLDNPDVFMVDVREPDEYAAGHIPGITLIPVGEIADRLGELPTDKEIILTCRTGNRSGQAAEFLRGLGFTNVHNMEGGIVAWREAGYEVE